MSIYIFVHLWLMDRSLSKNVECCKSVNIIVEFLKTPKNYPQKWLKIIYELEKVVQTVK